MSFLFAAAIAAAQGNTTRFDGKLLTDTACDTLWVEIYDNPGHMLIDRQPVTRDGSFTVHAIASQLYEVRVLTNRGDRIVSDHMQFRLGQPLEVRMPKSDAEAAPPAGPISARRLAHKPAKNVRKMVRKAEDLAAEGKRAEAADLLDKALVIDPEWFEAWNNLGTRRLHLGQYPASVAAFQKAAEIDPNNATVQANLGLALLFTRQPVQAEEAARRAMQFDPESHPAIYVAGMALLQQNKRPEEALGHLHAAAKTLPRALLATAEWQCRHNNLNACAIDLKAFINTPRGPNHENAEKWLNAVNRHLKGKQGD
ncbi:MAG TPA: tetratricopeptide repeat protein [Bryobacteraceae bacterium]|nr:tetratricopeptide repeat protein [Bryobacteraceae bacterium]